MGLELERFLIKGSPLFYSNIKFTYLARKLAKITEHVKHMKASSQGPEAYNAFKHAACKLTEFYNETKGQLFILRAINTSFLFRSQNKRKSLWIYSKRARANQMGQITKEARHPPRRSNCQYNRFSIKKNRLCITENRIEPAAQNPSVFYAIERVRQVARLPATQITQTVNFNAIQGP